MIIFFAFMVLYNHIWMEMFSFVSNDSSNWSVIFDS